MLLHVGVKIPGPRMYIVRTNAERMCAPTREDAACSSQRECRQPCYCVVPSGPTHFVGARGMGTDTHLDPFSCKCIVTWI